MAVVNQLTSRMVCGVNRAVVGYTLAEYPTTATHTPRDAVVLHMHSAALKGTHVRIVRSSLVNAYQAKVARMRWQVVKVKGKGVWPWQW